VSQVQGRRQKNFQGEGATEKDRKIALISLGATEKIPKMVKKRPNNLNFAKKREKKPWTGP